MPVCPAGQDFATILIALVGFSGIESFTTESAENEKFTAPVFFVLNTAEKINNDWPCGAGIG